ncbi:MAG: tetratricopeptide repeat protein [Bacteroidales bacterium]
MRKYFFLFGTILFLLPAFISCNSTESGKNGVKGDSIAKQLSELNAAIKKDPKNSDLLTQRSEYFVRQELFNNALSDINKAIELDPKNVKAYTGLSGIYLLMGKPQQSLDALNLVLKFDDKNADIYLKMAKLYLIMKDYENCASSIQKTIEIDPNLADAYYLKGMALMENDKMDLAIESFQRSVNINQTHFDALMQLGYIWEKRDVKISIDYFKSATKANPKSTEALYNLGLLYQDNGQPEKAILSYEEIIKLDTKNKLAFYNIGYVNLVYLNKYTQGAEYFSKAIALDSGYTDAWYNRGLCYELLKDKEKATNDYQQVLKLKVNDPKAIEGMNRLDKLMR